MIWIKYLKPTQGAENLPDHMYEAEWPKCDKIQFKLIDSDNFI